MPTGAEGDAELEDAIDRLYQGPLERFTADRNQLATTLKKGGGAASAERVKALAKPSATAWAVNQAWWHHRERFQAMLDAGAAQRRAHVAFAEGRKADVRAAGDARQAAVRDVTEAALDALGGRKTVAPDAQYRISGSVEALASSGVPEGETPGRFTRDLQSSGLDALSALAEAAGAMPRPTIVARGTPTTARSAPVAITEVPARAASVSPAPADRGETARARKQREAEEAAARTRAAAVARAEARLEQSTSALDEATRAAEAAAAEEASARASLEALTQRRAELEASLDAARAEEAAARRALSGATATASRAGLDQARAARDAERARDALERAARGH